MKYIINKICELLIYFCIAVLSVTTLVCGLCLSMFMIIGPAYLADTYDSYWWLLLYLLFTSIGIACNPEYLTRKDDCEMP